MKFIPRAIKLIPHGERMWRIEFDNERNVYRTYVALSNKGELGFPIYLLHEKGSGICPLCGKERAESFGCQLIEKEKIIGEITKLIRNKLVLSGAIWNKIIYLDPLRPVDLHYWAEGKQYKTEKRS